MLAPASLLLVHGAGSRPCVYDDWFSAFPTLTVGAVDLQEGLAVEEASMSDYADRVVAAARTILFAATHGCRRNISPAVQLTVGDRERELLALC